MPVGETLLFAVELIAVAAFAVSGGLVASRKRMDILGFALLGTVTGIGGGTVRDMLLGTLPVFWVKEPVYLVICAIAAATLFFLPPVTERTSRLIQWVDAVGLALFAIGGAQKALAAGTGPGVALVMAMITASFGGMIRDVLGGEIPLLLRRDVYVTAALLGAAAYLGTMMLGLAEIPAMMIGFAVAFGLRAVAIHFGWSLPTYRRSD